MQILGQAVKHNSFGEGVVKNISGRFITICFPQGDKKFLYPDAFSHFLRLNDLEKQKLLNEKNRKKAEEEQKERELMLERQERRQKLHTMKISPNSQAAFHAELQDIDEIMEQGSIFSGTYLSGASKGRPRIPSRLKPNSVCLITGLPEGGEEKDRRIFGAFAVNEEFLGEYCEDGIIQSHDTYKIALDDEESLPFWEYFEHADCLPQWGKIPFKYVSNTSIRDILYDLTEALADTEQAEMLHEFYQYFCSINHLSARLPKAEELVPC